MKLLCRLAMVIAFATTGCVVGEDPLPTEDDMPPQYSEAALGNNAETAFNFFVSKGLTDIQAAGIVGNLMQESSIRPTAVELGGGPGRGIAQWSVGGRWNSDPTNLTSYAATRGLNRWALSTQLAFIWHEMDTIGNFGLAQVRAATTLSAAVRAFQDRYERCGTCAQARRMEYAQQALEDYGGGGGTGTGTGTGGTGGGTGEPPPPGETCYSGTLQRDVPENTCVESVFDGEWYQCSNGSWIDRWSDPDPCVSTHPL